MEDKKKWQTPRGAAASRAKMKYNVKNYDRLELKVKKGIKQKIEEAVKEYDYNSTNQYVFEAIKKQYKMDSGKELEE